MRVVFLYELRRNLRRKGYLFSTFGLPVLIFALLFGYNALSQATLDEQTPEEQEEDFGVIKKAGYVDLSGLFGETPENLTSFLVAYPDEATALSALHSGEIDIYYLIPADYLESGVVQGYLPKFSFGKLSSADGPVRALIVQTLGRNVSKIELARLQQPAAIEEFNLERAADAVQDEDADFVTVYAFVIVFFIGIIITNGYLMQSVIEEKENRVIEILISSLKPTELLMGKVFALSILGLVQIVVWVATLLLLGRVVVDMPAFAGSFLTNIQLPLQMLPVILIYFVLAYIFIAAGYSAVGALSNSMREGPQFAAIFIIPLFVPYYFAAAFIETPNSGLPQILSLIPPVSPLSMVMRVTVSPAVPLAEIALSIALMILAVFGMIWLAARLFRVQTLLAGQVPKLKDIPKLIRG